MKKKIYMGIVFLLITLGAAEAYVYSTAFTGEVKKGDAVMILGCQVKGDEPSEFLKARTLRGKELFDEGYGEYIIVSGGQGPDENLSEAKAMQKILLDNGIPEEKILMEDKSTSTIENFEFSKAIMRDKGIENIVVVSNKSHLTRVKMVCEKLDIKATYSGVFVIKDLPKEIFSSLREIPALIKYYFFY